MIQVELVGTEFFATVLTGIVVAQVNVSPGELDAPGW